MRKRKNKRITASDLAILFSLAEKPASMKKLREFFNCSDVGSLFGCSNSQVRYAVKKLENLKLITPIDDPKLGIRTLDIVFKCTSSGKKLLKCPPEQPDWTAQLPFSAFLTWIFLSSVQQPEEAKKSLKQRKEEVEHIIGQLKTELEQPIDHTSRLTALHETTVRFMIQTNQLELEWLKNLNKTISRNKNSSQDIQTS